MAKALCPCCGVRVRFGLSGTAERARVMLEVSECGVTPALVASSQLEFVSKDQLDWVPSFIATGDAIYNNLIDHVHRRAVAGITPDVMALNKLSDGWLLAAGEFVEATAKVLDDS